MVFIAIEKTSSIQNVFGESASMDSHSFCVKEHVWKIELSRKSRTLFMGEAKEGTKNLL